MQTDHSDADDPLAGGLSHTQTLALQWQPTPTPPDGAELAELNRRAVTLLAVLGSLEEPPPLPDAPPQLALHLQRLDQKLDLLLDLVGCWLGRDRPLPPAQPVRLGVRGVLWQAELPAGPGRVSLYLRAGLPAPLQLPALLRPLGDGRVLAEFQHLEPPVVEALERYLFRCHRRAVAQARRPASHS
ncbi:PilZ domain-containing protein [Immundisolibacter sp.]|uniref:PilZ domain-containing protein n=1 Tax=Immundisolibacter sp. TaxID=1934948 RepID=UPI002602F077|nr:PilZ domain-containing protein [Immundisolibacter sp.]MDD3650269.1 PilZ domain-containing protein [Immundisolibacter sp.]